MDNQTSTTVSSKEQERAALAKIRKIVETLGPGSYLATAFDGAFEDADQNIEYDAAFSYKERFHDADIEKAALKERLVTQGKLIEKMQQESIPLHQENDMLKTRIADATTREKQYIILHNETISKTNDATARAETAERLVTELKAKLYDYMTR